MPRAADLRRSDLLGQLAPDTMEDIANLAVTVWQPWVGIPMGGAPLTEGQSHVTGEAVRPYPIDKLRAAFCPSADGSAEELKADIDEARLSLTEDFEATVGSVKDSMTEWSGDAADNFKDYIANVVDAKDQLHLALDAAWEIMDMCSQIITKAHDDVKTLLDESISKAEAATVRVVPVQPRLRRRVHAIWRDSTARRPAIRAAVQEPRRESAM